MGEKRLRNANWITSNSWWAGSLPGLDSRNGYPNF